MNDKVIGIYREVLHSPDREFDDHEILRLTGEKLADKGVPLSLFAPEEIRAGAVPGAPDFCFIMCEQAGILAILEQWEKAGTLVVNSTRAIFNTYRNRMVPLLKKEGVSFPAGDFVKTERPSLSAFRFPVWVKRGDVHNTCREDVSYAASAAEAEKIIVSFKARGIESALIQEHVPGDLIKFYGVGNGRNSSDELLWSNWFYHKNQTLQRYPFDESKLREVTRNAAHALGLEIYGGDVIVTPGSKIYLIDINAWPSFALFRPEASDAIAAYLEARLAGHAAEPAGEGKVK